MSTGIPTWYTGWSQPHGGPNPFQVTVTRPIATLAVVAVVGELDIATSPKLDVRLDLALHDAGLPKLRDLIVDFTRVQLLTAAGVNSVLRAEAAALAQQVRLQLVVTSRPVARVLTLLDLDDHLCVRSGSCAPGQAD
jgi:anti-anti-sigma factor